MAKWMPASAVAIETDWRPASAVAVEPDGPPGIEPEMGTGTAQLEEDVRGILPEIFEQPILTPEQIRRQIEGPGKAVLKIQDQTGMDVGDILDAYGGVTQTEDEFMREITRRKYTNIVSELAWAGEAGLLDIGGMEFGTVSAGIKLAAKVLRDGPWQTRTENNEGFQRIVSVLRRKSEWWDQMARRAYEEAQSGQYMTAEGGGAKAFIANAVARTLPLMALSTTSAVLTGGTSLGPMAGAFLAAAFAERERIYRGALADGATEEQAQLEGMIGGTINGVIEFAQVSKILRLGKGAGDPVMKEFAAAVRGRAMAKILKAGAKLEGKHLADAIQEGFEEVAQQWVGEGLAIMVHGKDFPTAQDALTMTGQAFAGGMGAGWFLGGGTLVVEGAAEVREAAQRVEPVKELPKPDMVMTPEQLTQYEEKLTAKEAEIAAEKAKPAVRAEGAAAVAAGEEETAAAPAGEVVEKGVGEAAVDPEQLYARLTAEEPFAPANPQEEELKEAYDLGIVQSEKDVQEWMQPGADVPAIARAEVRAPSAKITSARQADLLTYKHEIGRESINSHERQSMASAMQTDRARKAMADPDFYADKVLNRGELLHREEEAGLTMHLAQLRNELESVRRQIADSTDDAAKATLGAEEDRIEARQNQVLDALDIGGSDIGRALQIRQLLLNERLEPEYVKRKWTRRAGKAPSPETAAKIDKMTAEHAAMTAQIQQLQAKLDARGAETAVRRRIARSDPAKREARLKENYAKLKTLLEAGC